MEHALFRSTSFNYNFLGDHTICDHLSFWGIPWRFANNMRTDTKQKITLEAEVFWASFGASDLPDSYFYVVKNPYKFQTKILDTIDRCHFCLVYMFVLGKSFNLYSWYIFKQKKGRLPKKSRKNKKHNKNLLTPFCGLWTRLENGKRTSPCKSFPLDI